LLSVLSKVDGKILVSFEQIQNFEVLNLAMANVKNVNIAVTYPSNGLSTKSASLWGVDTSVVECCTGQERHKN
jgi:hypothetical protein